MKKTKVLILIQITTGFGDQYASILTAYAAFLELKKMNYDVRVGFEVRNQYFNSNQELSIIYDLSSFNTEIIQIKTEDVALVLKEYTLLDKARKTIQIYVDQVNDELLNYKFDSYDRLGMKYSKECYFKNQFLQKDILDIANEYAKDKVYTNAVQFRCCDTMLSYNLEEIINHEFYGSKFKKLEQHLKNNPDKLTMLTSNNYTIRDYFDSNYKNIFINKFTHTSLKLYNIDTGEQADTINVSHSKEILAEMTLFTKCFEIYEINTFPSNFLTYGITHSEIHKDQNSKLHNIIKTL